MRVLVVGAGIAGPTSAYWLRQAGFDVTIVEHASALRSGGYLIDFWGAGFDVAERMGIVPELRARGYVMTEARSVDRNGHRVAGFRPEAVIQSNERYISIARSDLAAVICGALDPGVEMVFGDSVRSVDPAPEHLRVRFDSGLTRDFDLLIGADGLHSRVRRLVFGPDARYEDYLGMVFAAFEAEHYPKRDELVAMMYAEVGCQCVRLSLRDDTTLCLFSLRHDGAIPSDRAAQERLLRRALGHCGWEVPQLLDAMSTAKNLYFDSVSQIRMPSWTSGRVALVGDAAACPSFLAGQGSALAMVEAYVLATQLAMHADPSLAFRRYEEQLAPFVLSKQDAAKGLRLGFAPKNRFELLIRNLIMRAMSLPKIADLAMGRSFHDALTLPPFPDTRRRA